MNARKVLSFIIAVIVVFVSSCAYAKVSPDIVAEDSRIQPFIGTTKESGFNLLPGRYAQLYEIPLMDGSASINAPSHLIIEIGERDSESGYYPAYVNVYGKEPISCWIDFDTSGKISVIKAYTTNSEGKHVLSAEAYVTVIPERNTYSWVCVNAEDGHVSYLLPIDQVWFSEGWYKGSWVSDDGKYKIQFKDEELFLQDKSAGKFTVSDNRFTTENEGILYVMRNVIDDSIVISFADNRGYPENAMIFRRAETPEAQ